MTKEEIKEECERLDEQIKLHQCTIEALRKEYFALLETEMGLAPGCTIKCARGFLYSFIKFRENGFSWPSAYYQPAITCYRLKKDGKPYLLTTEIWTKWKKVSEDAK